MAAIVPPSGTAVCRTPSAQARLVDAYARNTAPAPAMGTTAVPIPDTTSARSRTDFVSALAAAASPIVPTAVPANVDARRPNRSTAIPAAMNASPDPNKLAVNTAPSSNRLRPNRSVSSGPSAGSPKLTTETAVWAADADASTARGEGGDDTGAIILALVYHDAMARNQRRRLVGDAVELEQAKEAALLEQLEETVAELEGSRIDEEALGRMTPEDADVVRRVLAGESPGQETSQEEEEPYDDWLEPDADPEAEARELQAEIGRLEEEIARSRRVRESLERYLSALDS